MALPHLPAFGIIENPLVDSVFATSNILGSPSPPPIGNDFLLLTGQPFLLLSGNQFLLL